MSEDVLNAVALAAQAAALVALDLLALAPAVLGLVLVDLVALAQGQGLAVLGVALGLVVLVRAVRVEADTVELALVLVVLGLVLAVVLGLVLQGHVLAHVSTSGAGLPGWN